MSLVYDREEGLEHVKKYRKKIVEISSIKIYNIIKKLHKELPVKDITYVCCLPGCITLYGRDVFIRQLRHVYNSLEFNKKDRQVLSEYLDGAEKEEAEREAEREKFYKKCTACGLKPFLPPIGRN